MLDSRFCWQVAVEVMKCAWSLSAIALPSVISCCEISDPKNAVALPVSVIANIWQEGNNNFKNLISREHRATDVDVLYHTHTQRHSQCHWQNIHQCYLNIKIINPLKLFASTTFRHMKTTITVYNNINFYGSPVWTSTLSDTYDTLLYRPYRMQS